MSPYVTLRARERRSRVAQCYLDGVCVRLRCLACLATLRPKMPRVRRSECWSMVHTCTWLRPHVTSTSLLKKASACTDTWGRYATTSHHSHDSAKDGTATTVRHGQSPAELHGVSLCLAWSGGVPVWWGR